MRRINNQNIDSNISIDTSISPNGLAIDYFNQKLYMIDTSTGDILRSNFDGSSLELVHTPSPGYDVSCIVEDLVEQNIYFSETNSFNTSYLYAINVSGVLSPNSILFPSCVIKSFDVSSNRLVLNNNNTNILLYSFDPNLITYSLHILLI